MGQGFDVDIDVADAYSGFWTVWCHGAVKELSAGGDRSHFSVIMYLKEANYLQHFIFG